MIHRAIALGGAVALVIGTLGMSSHVSRAPASPAAKVGSEPAHATVLVMTSLPCGTSFDRRQPPDGGAMAQYYNNCGDSGWFCPAHDGAADLAYCNETLDILHGEAGYWYYPSTFTTGRYHTSGYH